MNAARTEPRGRHRKSFREPPFWTSDARHPLLSSFSLSSDREKIENDLDAYIDLAYKADGVVFSCIAARMHIFSQVRFLWRSFNRGTPGDFFSTPELELLRRPAPGQSTSNLLTRMEVFGSLAGNYFATTADDAGRLGRRATGTGRRIAEMRPDWVTLVIGSNSGDPNALDAKVVGYLYEPRVRSAVTPPEPVLLQPDEVVHYAPEPDPIARYRGMSWLTPVIREIGADKAATEHKAKFFENGATPGVAIKFDKDTGDDEWQEFVDAFKQYHEGAWNAYKTLFLAAGADVTPIGMDLRQLDFRGTQGAGETRIAMASGIHPVILGASEGLQGSSLNEGNFGAARRLVSDKTLRHLWTEAAASLETILTRPSDAAQLWIDTRDVAFLREDATDVAAIQGTEAQTIRTLLDAGYDGESVVQAVTSHDWTKLRHSGLFSVQLQPPGSEEPEDTDMDGIDPETEPR